MQIFTIKTTAAASKTPRNLHKNNTIRRVGRCFLFETVHQHYATVRMREPTKART
jgi:hypothetical protein